MRGRGRTGLAAVVVLALMACMFPASPPTILDPKGALVVAARAPLPVPMDDHGTWPLVLPRLGILGNGRTLARIGLDARPLWMVELPPELAITRAAPGPGSAYASPQ